MRYSHLSAPHFFAKEALTFKILLKLHDFLFKAIINKDPA
jgi:hypothetical protein